MDQQDNNPNTGRPNKRLYTFIKQQKPDSREINSFIWLVMIKMPFLLLNSLNDINCGHVRKCVMRSIIFWTIYL